MNNLNICTFVNTSCQLVSVDNTSYASLNVNLYEYISLEFTVNYDDTINNNALIKSIDGNSYSNVSAISLPKDGVFNYYKLMIPKLDALIIESDGSYKNILLNNEIFYYNNFIYNGKNSISSTPSSSKEEFINNNISVILENSEKITDYLELRSISSIKTYIYSNIFVSYCKIEQCLLNLQKKIIDNPNPCLECSITNQTVYLRDFLLASIHILKYLLKCNKYSEIQRLIERLQTCTNICEGDDNINSCGCGTIEY